MYRCGVPLGLSYLLERQRCRLQTVRTVQVQETNILLGSCTRSLLRYRFFACPERPDPQYPPPRPSCLHQFVDYGRAEHWPQPRARHHPPPSRRPNLHALVVLPPPRPLGGRPGQRHPALLIRPPPHPGRQEHFRCGAPDRTAGLLGYGPGERLRLLKAARRGARHLAAGVLVTRQGARRLELAISVRICPLNSHLESRGYGLRPLVTCPAPITPPKTHQFPTTLGDTTLYP